MSSTSLRAVTALIIGGGPVARIIGRHLKLSGIDDIGLLLKPKYAPIADQGFELHQLRTLKKKRLRQRYDDFKILTSVSVLEKAHYDQIYICVSGPDLRSGWLEEAWPHLRHSVWIPLTPGVDDQAYLLQTIPERFLVMGRVGFIAYDAPLPNENISPPGIAYWFPPWRSTQFRGADAETTAIIARTFERAGMPTSTSSSFDSDRLYENAGSTAFAAALEIHNWDFRALLADSTGLARLCVTQGEIGTAVYAKYQRDSTLNRRLRKPFWWKMTLKYLDGFVPFSLPEYLKHHFSKHRRQMEQQFGDFIRLVRASGGEPTATESLARDWSRKRPALAERSTDHLIPMGMTANTASRSVFSETGELGGETRGKAAADASSAVPTQAHSAIQGPPVQSSPVTQPVTQQQAVLKKHPQQQGFPPQQQQQGQGHPQQPGRQNHRTAQPYPQDHTLPPHARDDD